MLTDHGLRRVVRLVALLNLGYFAVVFAVALSIGSFSLFADSVENTAAVPRGPEHLGDGGLQAFMDVRDDELNATQSELLQAAQEPEPEDCRL